jgi:hypothetical protein
MHAWLVFLHVASVLGFLLAHGASAMVMFRLRDERVPARLCALLDLSQAVGGGMAITAGLLVLTGLVGGFTGRWWGQGWIWASLGLFLAISLAMSALGRVHFERVRRALGIPNDADRKRHVAPAPLPPDQLAAVLAAGRPGLLAGVGLVGLAVITWLMMFKPF